MIKNNLSKNKNSIMVSIYCLAFNHKDYIRDALEGFVNQKTNFEYEVIINDDASSDGTDDIIREYEEKYPNIIKPIYQTENQYSKHISILDTYIYPRVNGKYIAVCEGDDYWISDNKLQKQFDFLESHPEYAACTHCAILKDYSLNREYVFNPTKKNYSFGIKDIIIWDKIKYQTASLMARKEYFIVPKSIDMNRVGDYPRAVYLMINGGIFYFKDVMSVYRACTPGSWSSVYSMIPEKIINHMNERLDYLERLNQYTNKKYVREIEYAKRWCEYNIYHTQKNYKCLIKDYKDILKDKNLKDKLKVYGMAFSLV